MGHIISERDQTIMEQQKVIRRLLRKEHNYHFKKCTSHEDEDTKEDAKHEEDPLNSDTEENETQREDVLPINFSISVPNLSDIKVVRPPVLRSISDNDERKHGRIKFNRRAKNREKLMSMKRYSCFLKRPEILETVYSVESEDGNDGKSGEGGQEKNNDQIEAKEVAKEEEKPRMTLAMITKQESETTEYSCSTDSESIQITFSETNDKSTICSEICSRRSSAGSRNSIENKKRSTSRSMEDIWRGLKIIQKRKNLLRSNRSISLDYGEGV